MALHRLQPDAKPPLASRSVRALRVWAYDDRHHLARSQSALRISSKPALTVATLAPLVLTAAVGGVGRPAPASTSPRTTTVLVAVVATVVSATSGPAVVAAARPPTGLHIAQADRQAQVPASVVNSQSAVGIPSTALAAYRNAEQKMAVSDPDCGVSWNLLAGIGHIESGHANGGATDTHGTAVLPIYGPALDGTLPGNEVIAQSSEDGRVSYARALGPMQFLPGTWARYASDGDGDGVADPQNLYDSTLTAARYLCSGGMNLRDPSQVMGAILRYNNSTPYARNVLGWAAAYDSGVVPVDLPPVTGPSPPLGDVHLENPEGLGPGLPLNIHGLPSTDPLAQEPLIDFGQQSTPDQHLGSSQSPVSGAPNCTVICVGH